jgi:hypothetical protein
VTRTFIAHLTSLQERLAQERQVRPAQERRERQVRLQERQERQERLDEQLQCPGG